MGRRNKASAQAIAYTKETGAHELPRLLGRLPACHRDASCATVPRKLQKQTRRKRDVLLGAARSGRRKMFEFARTVFRGTKHALGSAAHSVGDEVQHVSHEVSQAVQHMGHEIAGAVHHMGDRWTTPGENMQAKRPGKSGWSAFLADCVVNICNPNVLCNPTSSILGRLVKSALASLDSEILGVKVSVGDVKIDALYGKVEIRDLIVANPEGYFSEYLLRADRILVDVDTQILVRSLGSMVDVEEVIFEGLDVIVEKKFQTSNISDMLTKLSGSENSQTRDNPQNGQVQVVWHKVMAKDVGAKLALSMTHGHGIRVEVSDMSFEDFDKHKGSDHGRMTCALSARVLLRTLIKSIVATLLGKETTKHFVHGFHKLEGKLRKAPEAAMKSGCLPWKSSPRK